MQQFNREQFESWWENSREKAPYLEAMQTAAAICGQVESEGDAALCRLTRRFDNLDITAAQLEVPRTAWEQAYQELDEDLRQALELAAEQIAAFHRRSLLESWSQDAGDGLVYGQKVTPVERAGVYAPGGRGSYPSSVLMGVIPARLAGTSQVVVCTPPGPGGQVAPLTLAAAYVSGADRLFRIGGAQAIAALAFGTQTVPAVDLIAGPGNRWVTAAKKIVFGRVAIDNLAGPSEVVVVADESAEPLHVAVDLLAQAEHDPDAFAYLFTTGEDLLDQVVSLLDDFSHQRGELWELFAAGPPLQPGFDWLQNLALVLVEDQQEAIDLVNRVAPEHLSIQCTGAECLLDQVKHSGAIFLGGPTSVVFGDYAAGPNHVLPTAGGARMFSPLDAASFQKRSNWLQLGPERAAELAPVVNRLAISERMLAHAASARARGSDGVETTSEA